LGITTKREKEKLRGKRTGITVRAHSTIDESLDLRAWGVQKRTRVSSWIGGVVVVFERKKKSGVCRVKALPHT